MRHKSIFVALAVGALLIGAGCGKKAADENANTNIDDTQIINETNADLTNLNDNLNTNTAVTTNANTNVTTNLNTNSAVTTNANTNTAVTTNTNSVANTNTTTTTGTSRITLTSPTANAVLTTPIVVSGKVTATTTKVYASVIGGAGKAIFDPVTISVKSDGSFSGKIPFDFTTTKSGEIHVYLQDDAGTQSDLVTVPVQFTLSGTTNANASTNANSNTNS